MSGRCEEACDRFCLMYKGLNCRYTTPDEYATLLKEQEDRINMMKTGDRKRRKRNER